MFNFKSKSNDFHIFKKDSPNDLHIFKKTLLNVHKLKVICLGAILVKSVAIRDMAKANLNINFFTFLKTKFSDIMIATSSFSDKIKVKLRIPETSTSEEKMHAKILLKLGFIKTNTASDSKFKYVRRLKTSISTKSTASVGKLINKQYIKVRVLNASATVLDFKNYILTKFRIKNDSLSNEALNNYIGKPKKLNAYQNTLLCDLPESLKSCCFNLGTESWKEVSTSYTSWDEVRSNFATWQDLI